MTNYQSILFLDRLDDNQLASFFTETIISCFGSDCVCNNNNNVSFYIQYNNGFNAISTAAVDDNSIATHGSIVSMFNSAVCDGQTAHNTAPVESNAAVMDSIDHIYFTMNLAHTHTHTHSSVTYVQ